jgi:hypothetical protein
MKNGLGEDITEGKISYPIVYCFSNFRGRRNSICSLPPNEEIEHGGLYQLLEKNCSLDDSSVKSNGNLEKSGEIDLIDLVNKTNVFSLRNMEKVLKKEKKADSMKEDINSLVQILQEKTKDPKKISKAIKILNSNLFFFVNFRIWGH